MISVLLISSKIALSTISAKTFRENARVDWANRKYLFTPSPDIFISKNKAQFGSGQPLQRLQSAISFKETEKRSFSNVKLTKVLNYALNFTCNTPDSVVCYCKY